MYAIVVPALTEYEAFALSNVAKNLDYAIKIRFVIKDLLSISVTDKKFRCSYMSIKYKMLPLEHGQSHNYIVYEGVR